MRHQFIACIIIVVVDSAIKRVRSVCLYYFLFLNDHISFSLMASSICSHCSIYRPLGKLHKPNLGIGKRCAPSLIYAGLDCN